jgi:hypothetical protein
MAVCVRTQSGAAASNTSRLVRSKLPRDRHVHQNNMSRYSRTPSGESYGPRAVLGGREFDWKYSISEYLAAADINRAAAAIFALLPVVAGIPRDRPRSSAATGFTHRRHASFHVPSIVYRAFVSNHADDRMSADRIEKTVFIIEFIQAICSAVVVLSMSCRFVGSTPGRWSVHRDRRAFEDAHDPPSRITPIIRHKAGSSLRGSPIGVSARNNTFYSLVQFDVLTGT